MSEQSVDVEEMKSQDKGEDGKGTVPAATAIPKVSSESAAQLPPPLPQEWVKVTDNSLPHEDDVCIVWGRDREYTEGVEWYDSPWQEPDLRLTRGWWVIENGNTLTGSAERQAKSGFFDSRGAPFTTEALYWALVTPPHLHGWEKDYKPFRVTGQPSSQKVASPTTLDVENALVPDTETESVSESSTVREGGEGWQTFKRKRGR